jgi:hypothetical protein
MKTFKEESGRDEVTDAETAGIFMELILVGFMCGGMAFVGLRDWRRAKKAEFQRIVDLTETLSRDMSVLRQKVDAAERALARVEGRQYVKW